VSNTNGYSKIAVSSGILVLILASFGAEKSMYDVKRKALLTWSIRVECLWHGSFKFQALSFRGWETSDDVEKAGKRGKLLVSY
jgi:hypothetical protein